MAGAYCNKENWDEAIADCNQALELEPELAVAYNNRAWVCIKTCMYDSAMIDLNEAIRLEPNEGQYYANRAITFSMLGMEEEAQKDIDHAVTLGADRPSIEQLIEELKQ